MADATLLAKLKEDIESSFGWKGIRVAETIGRLIDAGGSVSELNLTPKPSSTGAEGTVFYDSDDDHLYVATE